MPESSIEALVRVQEKALQGVREAWDRVLSSTAKAPVPGLRSATEGLEQAVEAMASLAASATGPLRELVDGQRALAETLERWAELQRDSAEVISALARQQKLTADLLGATIAPFDRRPDGESPRS